MQEKQTADEAQARLLQRVAARETDALSVLYDQIAGPLFSVAIRILGDTAEAEEAIQDVFVQIWEKAATFDLALGTPFHWAVSITRHRAIDRLRSRQRRARLIEELGELSAAEPQPTAVAERLAGDEAGVVRSALADLPGDQRQAIEMAFFRGMTHFEIATALGEPLGTVKARIRRGLLKLREILGEYE